MIVICCVLVPLTAGDPSHTFHMAVQGLLTRSSLESETTSDEEGEEGKVENAAHAGKRAARQRRAPVPGQFLAATLTPRTNLPSLTPGGSLTPPLAGEMTHRNGVGATLRC
jgi:hypothetical protein